MTRRLEQGKWARVDRPGAAGLEPDLTSRKSCPDPREVRQDEALNAETLSSALTMYPEVNAGGFTRYDGTIAFYIRVDALLRALGDSTVVLDFGAGRGVAAEDPVLARRALRIFRGRAGKVIGADIDPAVRSNPLLDEALLISGNGTLELPDSSVDMVVSDYTFEHVEQPETVSRELTRVLRPGGWICARTPNRWGYIGLGAQMIPNRWHVSALARLQPTKEARDTFPTAYKLNTLGAVMEWFPPGCFEHYSYTWDSEATYVGSSSIGAWAFGVLRSVTPAQLRSTLMIFLKKHAPEIEYPSHKL